MRIFRGSYETDYSNNCDSVVICENESEIPKLLAERSGEPIEDIKKIKFGEVSKESVTISELSVADFCRLMSDLK